jgi:cobalt-precorrin 5A hydrolase
VEVTKAVIAAGLGCRAGCSPYDIVDALLRAVRAAALTLDDVQALFTADFKAAEAGIILAAEHTHKRLHALSRAQLQAQAARVLSPSARALERWGVPSISEAAALAGASALAPPGTRISLLGPRTVSGGATCALACTEVEA